LAPEGAAGAADAAALLEAEVLTAAELDDEELATELDAGALLATVELTAAAAEALLDAVTDALLTVVAGAAALVAGATLDPVALAAAVGAAADEPPQAASKPVEPAAARARMRKLRREAGFEAMVTSLAMRFLPFPKKFIRDPDSDWAQPDLSVAARVRRAMS